METLFYVALAGVYFSGVVVAANIIDMVAPAEDRMDILVSLLVALLWPLTTPVAAFVILRGRRR